MFSMLKSDKGLVLCISVQKGETEQNTNHEANSAHSASGKFLSSINHPGRQSKTTLVVHSGINFSSTAHPASFT